MSLFDSEPSLTKLLAITVTFMATAAWTVLLIWQSLMVCMDWREGYRSLDAVPALLLPLIGLVGTVAVAWYHFGKNVSGVLMAACLSLAAATFFLTVASVAGGWQIGLDFGACTSPRPR